MSDADTDLVFETILDAPPEKIWRALTIPEFRDRWLQPPRNVEVHVVTVNDSSLLTYSWLEQRSGDKSDKEESLVTIELMPNDDGTTLFRLTHAPLVIPAAANSNEPLTTTLMRAA